MGKELRYTGEFLSVAGVRWRVDILQDADLPFETVGELTFEADSPLVIEWSEKGKEEVICGSVATLKIESPGDRTYIDLYTVTPGGVQLNVYRDDELYWCGSLDPEFYEEPYERAAHYPVTLTFSDFGILERLIFDKSGELSVRDVITDALSRAGLGALPVDDKTYVSSYLPDDNTDVTEDKAHPGRIYVRADNFYDEDREPMTMEEVIEGMLQPLAMRITQRGGKVYVYDLNGLYQSAETTPIEWTSDSQTLGTDKVYNSVKVTFSPYADSEVSNFGDLEYGGDISAEVYNYHPYPLSEATEGQRPGATGEDPGVDEEAAQLYDKFGEFYSFESSMLDIDGSQTTHGRLTSDNFEGFKNYPNFNVFIGDNATGGNLAYINPQWCRYFHIEPLLGGPSATDGVLVGICTRRGKLSDFHGEDYTFASAYRRYFLKDLTPGGHGREILRTKKMCLPFISRDNQHYIRLSLEALIDPRYNPFTDGTDFENETASYNEYKSAACWVFLPVAVNLYDAAGEVRWHYTNRNIAITSAWGHLSYARGNWEPGAGSDGDAWLAYYDVNGPSSGNGILGWQTNRHCIGRPDNDCRKNMAYYPNGGRTGEISEMLKKIPAGEYIPYPPEGGWLEVVVYEGIRGFMWNEKYTADPAPSEKVPVEFDNPVKWARWNLLKELRWYLLKPPTVDIVSVSSLLSSAEAEDIEYSGWINPSAKEDLSIDTVCGSLPDTAIADKPTARGVFIDGRGYGQIRTLTRAGVTDHPENLLIGTLYSQFATRHMTLSGEAAIKPQGLCLYTDAAQPPEKKFILTSAVEDCRIDCGDSIYTELSPDEYISIDPLK